MKLSSVLLLIAGLASAQAAPKRDFGVLLLAHGGNAEWNAEVAKVVRALGERRMVGSLADTAHLEARDG